MLILFQNLASTRPFWNVSSFNERMGDDILIIPYWSKLLWFLTKVSLKQADRIYAVSDDIANKIIRDFKINREYVKVVPFGVDTELFRPEARKENGKRL